MASTCVCCEVPWSQCSTQCPKLSADTEHTGHTLDLATAASAHSQLQPLMVGTTLATRILTLRQLVKPEVI